MAVLARTDADGAVIDAVIRAAGVSRGTFYNYFRSDRELADAVAREVSDQMLRIVDPIVRSEAEPAVRVATGVRMVLAIARDHPQVAAFMVRGGPPAVGTQGLAAEYLPRDLAAGVAAGAFAPMPPRTAFDLVTGAVLAGCHTLLTRKAPRRYPEDMACMVLQALGVPRGEARAVADRPLPKLRIDPDSFIVRAEARASGARA